MLAGDDGLDAECMPEWSSSPPEHGALGASLHTSSASGWSRLVRRFSRHSRRSRRTLTAIRIRSKLRLNAMMRAASFVPSVER